MPTSLSASGRRAANPRVFEGRRVRPAPFHLLLGGRGSLFSPDVKIDGFVGRAFAKAASLRMTVWGERA